MGLKRTKIIMSAAWLAFSLPAAAPAFATTETQQPEQMEIFIDQTEVVRLPRTAGSVVIGNPSVAGVAVHDDRTLLLTGISFGSTNLVVLDNIGRTILERQITVAENASGKNLTIARGAQTNTYSCQTKCRPLKTAIEENPDGG